MKKILIVEDDISIADIEKAHPTLYSSIWLKPMKRAVTTVDG